MKAIVYTQYGPPDVLHLEDVAKPTPEDDEVLIKIYAASINEWDWALLRGSPFANRMTSGLFKPKKNNTLGCDISGRVDAVGTNVKQFHQGDEVFGDLSRCGWGGFAEFVCAREDALALKSTAMTFEEAAAVPQAGLLALQGLRKGRVEQRQKVLINGAGGGVGTFGIQIARSLGAEVTGVDSAEKLDTMLSIGADHVIDYTKEDFTENGQAYDLIIDAVAQRSLSDYRRSLNSDGLCVLVGGSSSVILSAVVFGSLGNKKIRLLLHKPDPKDLVHMNELFEAGKTVPVVDRCYALREVPEAFRYYGTGSVKGKVVITMDLPDHS